MPSAEFTSRFQRALKKKQERDPGVARAVVRTVELVLKDRKNQGLNTHLLDRRRRIWDAYVTAAIRLTFEDHGSTIIFRNNCRHDIIDRRQW